MRAMLLLMTVSLLAIITSQAEAARMIVVAGAPHASARTAPRPTAAAAPRAEGGSQLHATRQPALILGQSRTAPRLPLARETPSETSFAPGFARPATGRRRRNDTEYFSSGFGTGEAYAGEPGFGDQADTPFGRDDARRRAAEGFEGAPLGAFAPPPWFRPVRVPPPPRYPYFDRPIPSAQKPGPQIITIDRHPSAPHRLSAPRVITGWDSDG